MRELYPLSTISFQILWGVRRWPVERKSLSYFQWQLNLYFSIPIDQIYWTYILHLSFYFSNPEHARNIWHWTLSWVNLKIMRLYLIYVLFQLRWYIDLKVKMNTCRWKLLEQFKMNRPVPFNCMVPVLSRIYGKSLVVLVTVWRNVPQLASIS